MEISLYKWACTGSQQVFTTGMFGFSNLETNKYLLKTSAVFVLIVLLFNIGKLTKRGLQLQ